MVVRTARSGRHGVFSVRSPVRPCARSTPLRCVFTARARRAAWRPWGRRGLETTGRCTCLIAVRQEATAVVRAARSGRRGASHCARPAGLALPATPRSALNAPCARAAAPGFSISRPPHRGHRHQSFPTWARMRLHPPAALPHRFFGSATIISNIAAYIYIDARARYCCQYPRGNAGGLPRR